MATGSKRLPIAFYRTAGGAEPVRTWLMNLSVQERHSVGVDLAKVEFGWPVGMPVCRPLGEGLWEVRSTIASRKEARVLFCVAEGHMVLLHGFLKAQRPTAWRACVPATPTDWW